MNFNAHTRVYITRITLFCIFLATSTTLLNLMPPPRPLSDCKMGLCASGVITFLVASVLAGGCAISQVAATYGQSLEESLCDIQGYDHNDLARISAALSAGTGYCAWKFFRRVTDAFNSLANQ